MCNGDSVLKTIPAKFSCRSNQDWGGGHILQCDKLINEQVNKLTNWLIHSPPCPDWINYSNILNLPGFDLDPIRTDTEIQLLQMEVFSPSGLEIWIKLNLSNQGIYTNRVGRGSGGKRPESNGKRPQTIERRPSNWYEQISPAHTPSSSLLLTEVKNILTRGNLSVVCKPLNSLSTLIIIPCQSLVLIGCWVFGHGNFNESARDIY